MYEPEDEAPEEPMLFGMPLSMYPKAPAPQDRKLTIREILKLAWWPDLPPLYWTPPAKRGQARG